MASLFMERGFTGLYEIWPAPTLAAWRIIGPFAAFEAIILLAVPGKTFNGIVTPCGNVPVYKVRRLD